MHILHFIPFATTLTEHTSAGLLALYSLLVELIGYLASTVLWLQLGEEDKTPA